MVKYDPSVYKIAGAELRRRKNQAESDLLLRREEIFSRSPSLRNICAQLETTSRKYLEIVLRGGPDRQQQLDALRRSNEELNREKRAILIELTGDADYLKAKYTCPVCEDSGFKDGVRCRCFEQLLKKTAAEEFVRSCGVKLCDFSDFNSEIVPEFDDHGNPARERMIKNFNYARSYCESFRLDSPSLLFIGRTGLGKSFLSSCIAKEVLEKGFNVIIGQVATFVRRIQKEQFDHAEGNTLDSLIDCDLLVLDDLGSEFKTQFTESALFEILNARINAMRPTIISTNFSVSELNEQYNERLISRITGSFLPLMFWGKDVRPSLRKM